jgi:hypothetical protein
MNSGEKVENDGAVGIPAKSGFREIFSLGGLRDTGRPQALLSWALQGLPAQLLAARLGGGQRGLRPLADTHRDVRLLTAGLAKVSY